MAKKWKIIIGIAGALLLCVILGLIGFISMTISQKSDYNDNTYYASSNEDMNYSKKIDNSYGEAADGVEAEDTSSEIFVSNEDENQKLVYSGSTALSTEDINKTYKELTNSFNKYNAKLESLNEGSTYKNLIIRVPKEHFMDFYNSLSDLSGKITYSNINIDDVTDPAASHGA